MFAPQHWLITPPSHLYFWSYAWVFLVSRTATESQASNFQISKKKDVTMLNGPMPWQTGNPRRVQCRTGESASPKKMGAPQWMKETDKWVKGKNNFLIKTLKMCHRINRLMSDLRKATSYNPEQMLLADTDWYHTQIIDEACVFIHP